MKRLLVLGLATGAFVSYIPAALFRRFPLTGAGLFGTLWGLLLLPLLPVQPGPYVVAVVLLTLAAVPIATAAGRYLGVKDDPRIIVDETVGFWAAAAFLPRDPGHLAAAFLLFRLFDVTKPPPIRRVEKLPGGWGVVLDDTLAGVYACLCIRLWDILVTT